MSKKLQQQESILREKYFQCLTTGTKKSLFEHLKEIIKNNYLYYIKKEDVIITDRIYFPKKIMRYAN